uniref:Peptidase A1 domain-containing protein n=1 Tax=Leersia perrieri TaxID=77586 RepID=A0A0D9WPN8_9ORYZ
MLTGISVDGRKKLPIPASAFADGKRIDCADTAATRLSRACLLGCAFGVPGSQVVPQPDGPWPDTCYNLKGYSNVTVPTVSLGGATMRLDVPNGVLVDGCLAFRAVNERTFEVLYDVDHSRVGFRSGSC